MIILLLDLSPPLVLIVAVLIYKCHPVLIKVWGRDSFLSFLSFSIVCALINSTSGDKTDKTVSFMMFTRAQARKSGVTEVEQMADDPTPPRMSLLLLLMLVPPLAHASPDQCRLRVRRDVRPF